MLERRPRRAPPLWIEPIPDGFAEARPPGSREGTGEQRESVELAFVAALQHLPPRQRAALVLRDVLGFRGAEVAEVLDTIPSAVQDLLRRARPTVEGRTPPVTQQATLRALGEERTRELAARYREAWERGDAGALAAMLAEDALLAMPPDPTCLCGRGDVTTFLRRGPLGGGRRWRLLPTRANGQPAFGAYLWDEAAVTHLADSLHVLSLDAGGAVAELVCFLDASLFERFALPARLPGP